MILQILFVGLLIQIYNSGAENSPIESFDPRFGYEGRWVEGLVTSHGAAAVADWPCSSIHFKIEIDCTIQNNNSTSYIELSMFNLRTRMVAEISQGSKVLQTRYILGPSYSLSPPGSDILDYPEKVKLDLPNFCNKSKETYSVILRKLSEAEPFAPGIGNQVFRPSVIHFYGISDASSNVMLISNPQHKDIQNVHLEFVGASDTAGYCVDGTPSTGLIDGFLNGWKYGNCDYGFPGRVTKLLKEDPINKNIKYFYSVIAIAGIGLVQNANAAQEWIMGPKTMMDFYNRTLMSQSGYLFQTGTIPTLTIVSLGGNDYNHQNGNVPTQEEFSLGIFTFLTEKVWPRPELIWSKRVLFICGMGWP